MIIIIQENSDKMSNSIIFQLNNPPPVKFNFINIKIRKNLKINSNNLDPKKILENSNN